MSHTKTRITAALGAIVVAGAIVACSDDRNDYDHCPDWECGDGLFLAPLILMPVGVYGQPGYIPQRTIQPGAPGYRPTYVGKPPNFKPPANAKVNPPGAKPPANYKPPSGSTLTVQKAPKASNNVAPGSKAPSGGSGGQKTVQKAPAPKAPSGSGSRSGSSSGGRR